MFKYTLLFLKYTVIVILLIITLIMLALGIFGVGLGIFGTIEVRNPIYLVFLPVGWYCVFTSFAAFDLLKLLIDEWLST